LNISCLIRKLLILFFMFLPTLQLLAQVNSYFVYFSDKEGSPFSVDAPENYLTQQALDRRNNQGIAITEADLPVSPTYVEALNSTGSVNVRYTSRWFNGALIQATPVDAEAIKLLPYVNSIEYIAPNNVGGRIAGSDKFEVEGLPQSDTLTQFALLGVDQLRAAGIDGQGYNYCCPRWRLFRC
jgi:serine protease AprX